MPFVTSQTVSESVLHFFFVKIKKNKLSNKNKQECIFFFFGELTEILEKVFSVGLSVTS